MTQEHPITPPPELVKQWIAEGNCQTYCTTDAYLINKVARWGYEQCGAVNEAELQKARDEELEACCEQLRSLGPGKRTIDSLRAARRPKPPSLKEQAIDTIHLIRNHLPADMYYQTFLILRALESLSD